MSGDEPIPNPQVQPTMTLDQIREQLRPLFKEIMKGELDVLQAEAVPQFQQVNKGVWQGLEATGLYTIKITWGKFPRPVRVEE